MRQIPLFVNPNARNSKSARIERWLAQHGDRFAVIKPGSPEELTQTVKSYADEGEEIVAVAGGDGTINYAVRGLAGSNTALAVVPAGTANVFARELGLFDTRFAKAWKAIEQRRMREIDLFLANGTPFVQMAGIGLDARAIELTTRELKGRIGALAYVVNGIEAMMERQPRLTITTDDGNTYQGMAAIFGNGARYGGPMKIFRRADNTDGLLDMVLFRGTSLQLLRDAVRASFRGGFDDRTGGEVEYVRMAGCTVESDRETPYELDGDLAGKGTLRLERSPVPLKVCVLPEDQ